MDCKMTSKISISLLPYCWMSTIIQSYSREYVCEKYKLCFEMLFGVYLEAKGICFPTYYKLTTAFFKYSCPIHYEEFLWTANEAQTLSNICFFLSISVSLLHPVYKTREKGEGAAIQTRTASPNMRKAKEEKPARPQKPITAFYDDNPLFLYGRNVGYMAKQPKKNLEISYL